MTTKNPSILVAENSDTIGSIELILASQGYGLTLAASGRELLLKAHESPFALIICDIALPDMRGEEMVKALKQDARLSDIPVLIITPYSETIEYEIAKCIEAGAEEFLFRGMVECLIATQVKSTLEKARLREQEKLYLQEIEAEKKRIEELSITDALTGLYNRRYFNHIFEKELNRNRRDENTMVFMMLDVDHFKKYNDTYGHQKGDAVLQSMGSTLKNTLKRSGDYLFRLGGEEFGCLLTSCKQYAALTVAERVRSSIEGMRIAHAKNPPLGVVTASIGVKVVLPNEECDPALLYSIADEALYQAKRNGRNQIALAGESRQRFFVGGGIRE